MNRLLSQASLTSPSLQQRAPLKTRAGHIPEFKQPQSLEPQMLCTEEKSEIRPQVATWPARRPAWLHNWRHVQQQVVRRAERGEAQSFEFMMMVLPMMFIISLIGLVIIYWSARLPAKRAAIDCARSAIATLNQDVGVAQGIFVGGQSMENSGVAIDHLGVEVYPLTSWTRGATVRCVISGKLDIRGMPLLQTLPPVMAVGGIFEIYESADMQIEPLKSDWY